MQESRRRSMGFLQFLIFCSYMPTLLSQQIPIAAYNLTPSQSIIDGQTLISQDGTFVLGFFSPSSTSTPTSTNRYLGIWYRKIPVEAVVWVANRESPLNDTSGVLKISSTGNLFIVNGSQNVIWSTNLVEAVGNPILELLESGNLVLRDLNNGESKSYLWQSFAFPGSTALPGMRIGHISRTGKSISMSTWRNSDDPSRGSFTYGMDPSRFNEVIIQKDSRTYYRSGPWNGVRFSGSSDLDTNSVFTYKFTQNTEGIFYEFNMVNQSVIMKGFLSQVSTQSQIDTQSRFEFLTWVDETNSWVQLWHLPRDRCDNYAVCGAYGRCDVSNLAAICRCLKGFKPKSPQDWNETNWSQGCERESSLNCTKGDGFRKYTGVKLPDTTGSWTNTSMDLEDCRVKCLSNCSCMAYTYSDVRGRGSGCLMWFTDLIDIRQLAYYGQDINVRMAASDSDLGMQDSEVDSSKEPVILIVSITSTAGIIVFGIGSWCIWRKKNHKERRERDDIELPLYDFITISTATNKFSSDNMLGEGGFGPVYWGCLEGEQEIAVKRLSRDSLQGVDEFKNEVILISKLQHRNLVKLLGCCVKGEEKMLVYEYMQNKSLDSFIFDETESKPLDWQNRFDIILGIARGLLYLHHDSRLKIIHRDLKASNILLDREMVPKISDFGMARLFGGDQIEGRTTRVVGTYGYMSPEYAIDGHFSVKSDVFSFGVMLLEIISGKSNRRFSHPNYELNLLGHAWRLWNEDKPMKLVNETVRSSCIVEDVLRCIQIGLLCVQKSKEERPTMSTVVLMLSTASLLLPKPQQPGFYIERSTSIVRSPSPTDEYPFVSGDVTITMIEGR